MTIFEPATAASGVFWMRSIPFGIWIALSLCLGALGCASSKPKGASSASLAAVIVYSSTPQLIQRATLEVFQAELYSVAESSPTRLVFERRGNTMSQLAYSGWFSADVWVRVKVNIRSYDAHSHLVECEVYMVRGHGEKFFEEETKAFGVKRRPFEEMLDKIKNRLN